MRVGFCLGKFGSHLEAFEAFAFNRELALSLTLLRRLLISIFPTASVASTCRDSMSLGAEDYSVSP